MNNINYPSWEIGQKLPKDNPYQEENGATMFFSYFKVKSTGDIIVDSDEVHRYLYCDKLQDAWSYTEILKWLREEHNLNIYLRGLYVVDICDIKEETDYYIADVNNKPVLVEDNSTLDCYFFNTYEETLDNAILHCLQLIKDKDGNN